MWFVKISLFVERGITDEWATCVIDVLLKSSPAAALYLVQEVLIDLNPDPFTVLCECVSQSTLCPTLVSGNICIAQVHDTGLSVEGHTKVVHTF